LMGELEWNKALLTKAKPAGAGVFMSAAEPQEVILNIHCDAC